MRKLTLPAIIFLAFSIPAAMAAHGPLDFRGGKAGLYHSLQSLIDTKIVSHFGRLGSGAMILGLGLLLAGAVIYLSSEARSERLAVPPAERKAKKRKDGPEDQAEAEAEARAQAERRIAAMRQRTGEEAEAASAWFEEPAPVLVLRSVRGAGFGDARSWFGGDPRLGGTPWPIGEQSGRPLPFAAQIDCAELSALRPDSGLPETGSFAFFLGEGAVVHVADAVDGTRPPRTPPPDGLLPARDGEECFPEHPGPDARTGWPYWPVALHALDLPDRLAGNGEENGLEEACAALIQAAGAITPVRQHPFSAALACARLGIDPVPLWWHSVGLFAAQLRKAMHRSAMMAERVRQSVSGAEAQLAELRAGEDPDTAAIERQEKFLAGQRHRAEAIEEQRAMLGTAIEAIDWFRADRPDWQELAPAEREDFLTLHAEIREHCADLVRHHTDADATDLAGASIRAAMTGPDDALAALPAVLVALVDRDFRQPPGMIQQIFSPGACILNAARDHAGDALLLQLAADDLMGWRFGGSGAFQFWIDPRDAALHRWDRAMLTFEGR